MKTWRIAINCPEVPGHLNPSLTLGAELKRRGHDVRLTTFIDADSEARAAGIPLHPVAELQYPRGTVPETMRKLGTLSGFAASRFTIKVVQENNLTYLRELPRVWESEGIEAMLLDQISYGAASAAQALHRPYVTISNALWLSRDISSPPWSAPWLHDSGFYQPTAQLVRAPSAPITFKGGSAAHQSSASIPWSCSAQLP